MRIYPVSISMLLILAVYLSVIISVEINSEELYTIGPFLNLLPALLFITFFSFFLRYCRWYWLLCRSGESHAFGLGFLAYLSGFALTATPGKVGELIRVRYFSQMGSRPSRIVSVFIFERLLDLLVVLLIASVAAYSYDFFPIVALFVALIFLSVILTSIKSRWLSCVVAKLRCYRFYRVARLVNVLQVGIRGIKFWIKPLDLLVSFLLGLVAWLIVALSFCWLLVTLHIDIPFFSAVSSYPLAMLVGAASMLPGGLGSTEAAIIFQLTLFDVSVSQAVIAAIVIRFATLWFSIVCGFVSMLILESKNIHE